MCLGILCQLYCNCMVLFTLKSNYLKHRCLVVADAEKVLSGVLSSDSIQLKRQLEKVEMA